MVGSMTHLQALARDMREAARRVDEVHRSVDWAELAAHVEAAEAVLRDSRLPACFADWDRALGRAARGSREVKW